jgi:hypothetical protein
MAILYLGRGRRRSLVFLRKPKGLSPIRSDVSHYRKRGPLQRKAALIFSGAMGPIREIARNPQRLC